MPFELADNESDCHMSRVQMIDSFAVWQIVTEKPNEVAKHSIFTWFADFFRIFELRSILHYSLVNRHELIQHTEEKEEWVSVHCGEYKTEMSNKCTKYTHELNVRLLHSFQ